MPFVNIRIVKEVLDAGPGAGPRKAALAQKVSAAIAETVGIPQEKVWVVFEEVEACDWYVGAGSVAEGLEAS